MKAIVTIAALNLEHGGPPRTVPALCRALGQLGADVELITISEGRESVLAGDSLFRMMVIPTRTDRYHPASWSRQFRETLVAAVTADAKSIIYDVGVWLPSNHITARVAVATGTPFVISPRGMLSARALRVAGVKKKIAWQLYQKRDIQVAGVLHATSEAEAGDFRALGLTQPIAVIPNGTDVPPEVVRAERSSENVRSLLFLSRLHPIKGLADLVNAWAKVRPKGWRAVLAGPDENDHRREVESLIMQNKLEDEFQFVGPASDALKWNLMQQADLFVLPSYSENFGLVIAEALAAGVPVITTRATPWREITERRCGWWIEPGVEPLAEALWDACGRSEMELSEMGERGKALVMERYSWGRAAEKMLGLFHWILDGDGRPEWVR